MNAEAAVAPQHAQHDAEPESRQTSHQPTAPASQHAQHNTEPAPYSNEPLAQPAQRDSGSDSNSNPLSQLAAQHGQRAATSGSLTCNEMDSSRRARLQSVLDSYLPPTLKKKMVRSVSTIPSDHAKRCLISYPVSIALCKSCSLCFWQMSSMSSCTAMWRCTDYILLAWKLPSRAYVRSVACSITVMLIPIRQASGSMHI